MKMVGRTGVVVTTSITGRERMRNALQEVGEVHSINGGRDSTTLQEKGDLTLCMSILRIGVPYSSKGGYED